MLLTWTSLHSRLSVSQRILVPTSSCWRQLSSSAAAVPDSESAVRGRLVLMLPHSLFQTSEGLCGSDDPSYT